VAACGHLSPNVAPTAAFALPASLTAASPATFDASTSADPDGSIVSYAWDFGDGVTGTGRTAAHTFARSGTYLVTLTVTDDEGLTASVSRTLAVANSAPTAAMGAVGTLRVLTSQAFDGRGSADRDGSLTSYSWDFGDGGTATGPTAGHAYTWAGSYVVTLTVIDDEGAVATATRTVTVTDMAASGFKRLNASGLTSHKCVANLWTLQLKPVLDSHAPASVAVQWADGTRERVTRASVKSGTALYTTTTALTQIATKAWADVPTTSGASFTLASGPCQ
jgi:PKD repeat protein